eukprot:530032-Pelagomonas_calceolata.AAC.2
MHSTRGTHVLLTEHRVTCSLQLECWAGPCAIGRTAGAPPTELQAHVPRSVLTPEGHRCDAWILRFCKAWMWFVCVCVF